MVSSVLTGVDERNHRELKWPLDPFLWRFWPVLHKMGCLDCYDLFGNYPGVVCSMQRKGWYYFSSGCDAT